MATARRWTRDNLVAAVFIVMMAVLSWTAIMTLRQTSLIQDCVLPSGKLCKGDPAGTQKLVDSIVDRVNAHTDEVLGR